MDQLMAMRVFVAVAEERGFAAAARRLRLSAPAVTRAVAGLEDRMGARLLHRTTRVVRLTEAGARWLADSKRILGELEEAEAAALGVHQEPRGTVSLTAPVMFGRLFVAPLVLDFLRRHPAVQARLLLLDRLVSLLEEGVDVAVRIAELEASSEMAVRVGAVRRLVCASPAYLKQHGVPRRARDLAEHEVISFSAGAQPEPWRFTAGGRTEVVPVRARLVVSSTEVAVAAAVEGRGVARVLSYQVSEELRARKLRVLLPELEPPPLPVHVVHREGRQASARVRALVDFMVQRLRGHPALAGP